MAIDIAEAMIAFLASRAIPKKANVAKRPILTFAASNSGIRCFMNFFLPRPEMNFID